MVEVDLIGVGVGAREGGEGGREGREGERGGGEEVS